VDDLSAEFMTFAFITRIYCILHIHTYVYMYICIYGRACVFELRKCGPSAGQTSGHLESPDARPDINVLSGLHALLKLRPYNTLRPRPGRPKAGTRAR